MVSSYRFQVTGFRFQVSGFKFQVSGYRFQVVLPQRTQSLFNCFPLFLPLKRKDLSISHYSPSHSLTVSVLNAQHSPSQYSYFHILGILQFYRFRHTFPLHRSRGHLQFLPTHNFCIDNDPSYSILCYNINVSFC
jgi:hypothetical protein